MALVLTGCPDAGIDPPGDDSLSDDNEDTVIGIAAIPGVTVPTGGDTPVTTITETTQYTGTVSWSLADETFDYGTEYTATITLTAKTGYTLTGVEANFFTVVGADMVTHDADSGVITAVFPATYSVGDTGPSGGYVFYENPNYIADGWRYLEAAPYGWYDGDPDSSGYSGDADPNFQWGAYDYAVDPSATATAIGSGASNTANIVDFHDTLGSSYPEPGDYYTNPEEYFINNDGTVAAKVCANYSLENEEVTYNDWFLPSKDELDLIYENLYKKNLGGFSDSGYWSSSEYSAKFAWGQNFYYEVQDDFSRSSAYRVRPVRAF
jgi:hypothetical protein